MKAKQLKRVFKILCIYLLFISFLACSNNTPKHKESVMLSEVDINNDFESVTTESPNYKLGQDIATHAIPKNLKIIKSANAKYKVKNVKKTTHQIKQVAIKYGAYISNLRFENNLYKKENRFTIKIPEQHFDVMMDSIGVFVEFTDYENITTQDVTEEYIDIQTRLNTKLEVKQRYESILRKNAITVEDILATEDKLRVIQEEIEAAQGRLKYLTSKVSYSTIQIDLYETVDYKDEPTAYNQTFWSKIKNALSFGWEFIATLFIGIIHIWPLIIIGLIILFYVKKRLKKRK